MFELLQCVSGRTLGLGATELTMKVLFHVKHFFRLEAHIQQMKYSILDGYCCEENKQESGR